MSKYTFIHPIPVFQKCHPSSLIISKNRSSVCCTQQPISIPTTLSDTINLAAKSTQAAIEAGHKQICVTALPPGLNPVLEENFPFSLPALHTLASGLFTETPYLRNLPDTRILFSSAGGAAAFTASMDSKSPTATSYAIRDSTDNTFSPHANLLVSPITYRGDRVMDDLEAALAAQPDAIWVLLNPSLGVDRAVVGIKESSRRAAFRDMFFDAFYFRNLVEIKRPQLITKERGALLRAFPNKWQIYALTDDYFPVTEMDTMPSPDQITSDIREARDAVIVREKVPSGIDNQFLIVIAGGAAFVMIVYAALWYFPQ